MALIHWVLRGINHLPCCPLTWQNSFMMVNTAEYCFCPVESLIRFGALKEWSSLMNSPPRVARYLAMNLYGVQQHKAIVTMV